MKRFTELFLALEQSRRSVDKLELLREYFKEVPPEDAAVAMKLLRNQKPPRAISAKRLRQRVIEQTQLPEWLVDHCREVIGDTCETLALLVEPHERSSPPLYEAVAADDIDSLSSDERIIFNKLLTGTFRSPVSAELLAQAIGENDCDHPRPFHGPLESLGNIADWKIESKAAADEDLFNSASACNIECTNWLEVEKLTGTIILRSRIASDCYEVSLSRFTTRAILMNATAGRGREAGTFTEYTFGLRDGDAIVPIAKIPFTNAELEKFVRRNTVERFGPVYAVAPKLVCEIGFTRIETSKRHKSGVALTFPRMLRVMKSMPAEGADTLASLRALRSSREVNP